MNRTDRPYAVAEELRAAGRRGRTGAWLAARFEVSTRTRKRDVAALQEAGVPIWASAGPGGGYVLDAAATLPPLTFTAGGATAVAAALAAAPDLPYGPDGRSALTKVLGAMTPDGRDDAGALAERVWVRPDRVTGRSPVARVLDEALRDGRVVVLDYVDARRPAHREAAGRTAGLCPRGGALVPHGLVPAPAVFGDAPGDAAPVALHEVDLGGRPAT